jgi:hypothetical protein
VRSSSARSRRFRQNGHRVANEGADPHAITQPADAPKGAEHSLGPTLLPQRQRGAHAVLRPPLNPRLAVTGRGARVCRTIAEAGHPPTSWGRGPKTSCIRRRSRMRGSVVPPTQRLTVFTDTPSCLAAAS